MSVPEAAKTGGISSEMQHAGARGPELRITSAAGMFFVICGRCHHRIARLSMGALRGNVLTRAHRFSRSDSTAGKWIPGPEMACRPPCLAEVVRG